MKSKADDGDESRTIELRLDQVSAYPLIDKLLDFYAHIRHLLWRDLVVKNGSINELKTRYIAEQGLTARQFNSLSKEAIAKQRSLIELQALNRKDLESKIKATREKIGDLLTAVARIELSLSQISDYRKKCQAFKLSLALASKAKLKPKMPDKIKDLDRIQLIKKIAEKKEAVHQKKRRLAILVRKLDKLKASEHKSICFGSKAFFNNQFNLKSAGLSSHEEWKEIFQLKRSSQAFFIGSSDETAGNQNFQYDVTKKSFKIRLPSHETFKDQGKYLDLLNMEFPEHLRSFYLDALSKPEKGAKKTRLTKGAVSYRIVRRYNPKTLQKSYYIQASFSVAAPETFTNRENGAIGVDINSDHLAFTEVDRYGNFIESTLIPFNFRDKSSAQTLALIGDMVSAVVTRCEERHKPLVIEDLDFSQKKAILRESGKPLRSMLSSLAYMSFKKAFSSRCRRAGVDLILINPAYTSLIGAYKYQGLKISSHKKAALAIARRGLHYSERPRVYQLTFPAQAMMQESIPTDSKHVWKFYQGNRLAIKKLIMRENRPLHASKSILSLSGVHVTLLRSLQCERGSIAFGLSSRRPA